MGTRHPEHTSGRRPSLTRRLQDQFHVGVPFHDQSFRRGRSAWQRSWRRRKTAHRPPRHKQPACTSRCTPPSSRCETGRGQPPARGESRCRRLSRAGMSTALAVRLQTPSSISLLLHHGPRRLCVFCCFRKVGRDAKGQSTPDAQAREADRQAEERGRESERLTVDLEAARNDAQVNPIVLCMSFRSLQHLQRSRWPPFPHSSVFCTRLLAGECLPSCEPLVTSLRTACSLSWPLPCGQASGCVVSDT